MYSNRSCSTIFSRNRPNTGGIGVNHRMMVMIMMLMMVVTMMVVRIMTAERMMMVRMMMMIRMENVRARLRYGFG